MTASKFNFDLSGFERVTREARERQRQEAVKAVAPLIETGAVVMPPLAPHWQEFFDECIADKPSQPEIKLTDEQQNAIDYSIENMASGVVAIAGPAGSGKTTLIKGLIKVLEELEIPVTVTATTNKASYVLRKKGIDACTFTTACRRAVFRPPLDKLGAFLDQADITKDNSKINFPKALVDQFGREELEAALDSARTNGVYSAFRLLGIRDVMKYVERWEPSGMKSGVLIIDEASMLGEEELADAKECFRRIILVGDEYQLKPVQSEPVFWAVEKRVCLTQIHRQAADSQPLQLATMIRNGQIPRLQSETIDLEACRSGTPIIVWRNKTRQDLTNAIREKLGFKGMPPQPGEVLICRNAGDRGAKARGLINNSLWTVVSSEGFCCTLKNDVGDLVLEDQLVHIEELDQGYGVPFRFGYALTAHNAQGSEWEEVMVHAPDAFAYQQCCASNSKFHPDDAKHWLYTAVTRARTKVIGVTSRIQ